MFLSVVSSNLRNNFKRIISRSMYNLKEAHKLQEDAMLKENCILVDENDTNIGKVSKKDCHLVLPNGDIKLHRAFSVFLFNEDGDMLIQKRSSHKITFPDHYTNACCSHPLYDIQEELDENNALGIKRAAQRRLHHELGIPNNQARPENFHYLTRIHYKDNGDGIYGEHECDYILFLQKNVDISPNLHEVSEVRYLKKDQIHEEIQSLNGPLTPWFHLILKHRLLLWWDNLHRLKEFEDHSNIHKFE